MLQTFLAGAIMLAAVVIAMLFWECLTRTHDRLFGFFAVAFLLLGLERVGVEFFSENPHSLIYLVRLVAFVLILYAILDKNRGEKRS
jgi:hypothetical protein